MTNTEISYLVVGAFIAFFVIVAIKPYIKFARRRPAMRKFAQFNGYGFKDKVTEEENEFLSNYRIGPLFPDNKLFIRNFMEKSDSLGTLIIFDVIYTSGIKYGNTRSGAARQPATTIFLYISDSVKFNNGSVNQRLDTSIYSQKFPKPLWLEVRKNAFTLAIFGRITPIHLLKKMEDILNKIIEDLNDSAST